MSVQMWHQLTLTTSGGDCDSVSEPGGRLQSDPFRSAGMSVAQHCSSPVPQRVS
ncbi:hypothetical protein HMPREF9056_01416 [Actinomyces sp. oral taxon 170 str. F0386]|nr:hypothetical protein HMPREF9056_01416 [Actinomyces sp. oral taxon 170 str. F0386]